jgi:hypothetical protein
LLNDHNAKDAKDKNPADKYGRTPLLWQRFRYNSQDGGFNDEDSGIIARMAEHAKHATDAKDKKPADKYGRTPLQWRRFRYNSQDRMPRTI